MFSLQPGVTIFAPGKENRADDVRNAELPAGKLLKSKEDWVPQVIRKRGSDSYSQH